MPRFAVPSYQAQAWLRAAVRSGVSSQAGCSTGGSLAVIPGCWRKPNRRVKRATQAAPQRTAGAVINDRFSYLMTATGPLVPKRPDGSEPGTRSRNRDGTGSSKKVRGTANPGVIC